MDNSIIYYHYKHHGFTSNLLKKEKNSRTLLACLKMDQEITWNSLGSNFFKHNDYKLIIKCLLDSDQTLYNLIQFCKNNQNCFEIEIVGEARNIFGIFDGSRGPGHHIFASCPANLKQLIDTNCPNTTPPDVSVKWIHNYGQQKESTLDEFLQKIEKLKQDPQTSGVDYKSRTNFSFTDSCAAFGHLSFILDLRHYCGNVAGFNHNGLDVGKNLRGTVDTFHKNYVASTKMPDRQNVWTFLRTLAENDWQWGSLDSSLNWTNVKTWISVQQTTVLSPPVARIYKNPFACHSSPPDGLSQMAPSPPLPPRKPASIVGANIYEVPKNFAFVPPSPRNTICSPILPIKPEKKPDMVSEITSLLNDQKIAKIYNLLFKTDTTAVPTPSSIKIKKFLSDSIAKGAVIGVFSVPQSHGPSKDLLIVVNNVLKLTSTDVKTDLMAYVKDRSEAVSFFISNFRIFFENQNKTPHPVQVNEASTILSKILANVETGRIDGNILEEQSVFP